MTARMAALGPSPDDPSAVLFADEPAVNLLGEQLRQLRTGDWTTDLADPPTAGEPAVPRLTLRVATGPLRVALESNALVVSGEAAHLVRLADHLALYAEHNDLDEPGMHCHDDRDDYPDNGAWIAADSLPLMVAGWVPDR